MKSVVELKKIKQSLIKQGVKYCLGAYVDIHGVPKGKFVPVEHFEHFAQGSELYTGYALDGLGQAPNDDEISSVPDLNHIIQLPWRREVAWMPADNCFHGQPYPLNSRVLLKNILGEAAKMGFTFNLGIECEIYVLQQDEQGRLIVPNPDDNLEKSCYDVKRFMDQFPWLDEMVTTMNGLGWDVYSFDHEDGNSQFEFDFKYADALTMADRYIFFRSMAKVVGEKHGLLATFMPKPFADKTGNGAHFNMSLADARTGKNLFESKERPARARTFENRLRVHRRHSPAWPRALRGAGADGEQLQAPDPARRDELLHMGSGIQFFRHEQPHQLHPRADGRRALREPQRRFFLQPVPRRRAGAGRRTRRRA